MRQQKSFYKQLNLNILIEKELKFFLKDLTREELIEEVRSCRVQMANIKNED